ncbi:cytidine deaminase [bacterium]|nr:cytidine deaminase [bacterium]
MGFSGLLEKDTQVSKPSPDVTRKLQSLLPEHPFHISGAEAERIASGLGISKYQLMVELICVAKEYAVVPVSDYRVGSCAMGESGDLYLGVNVEFNGDNLSQTIHSEQSSFCNAINHGEKAVSVLAVSSEPCGGCRQFLNEMACNKDLAILIPERHPISLEELLPRSFGPWDLGVESGCPIAIEAPITIKNNDDELVKIALRAANKTYAPYTHCNAAVALRFKDGGAVSGFYLENVAFNPSLSPLQAALIMAVGKGYKWADIVEAVLVERNGCTITHSRSTSSLIKAVAPQAKFNVVTD